MMKGTNILAKADIVVIGVKRLVRKYWVRIHRLIFTLCASNDLQKMI